MPTVTFEGYDIFFTPSMLANPYGN